MIEKLEGIIISDVDYKENSKIVNILTKEKGIIGVVAKGTKRVKSNLAGLCSKLTYGYFHISKGSGNRLGNLLEVDIINSYRNIKKNIDMMSYSLYLLELAGQVYRQCENIDIYNNLISSLNKIEEKLDYQAITCIFELRMLEYLGIKPEVDCCVSCGNKLDIITISSYRGGYLCKKCLKGESIVNIKTVKLLRMFYYIDINKIDKLNITDNIKKELNKFIYDYYDRYSGIYLKSREFLISLNKL